MGEASDAFGYANTTKLDAARLEAELSGFFGLINGTSPLENGIAAVAAMRGAIGSDLDLMADCPASSMCRSARFDVNVSRFEKEYAGADRRARLSRVRPQPSDSTSRVSKLRPK